MKITITREDVLGRSFDSPMTCPLAKVMGRALNSDDISVGTTTIISTNLSKSGRLDRVIGTINPPFEKLDYNELYNKVTSVFETEFTPNENYILHPKRRMNILRDETNN